MLKRFALLVLLVVGVLAMLVPSTSSAKIPPKKGVCVEQTVGQLHIQIGYCP